MTEESIKERIRACLDLANHPGTPTEEAETALAMAQRLMTKYAIDEASLGGRVEVEDIVRDVITITGPYGLRRIDVAFVVANVNSCAAFRRTVRGQWTRRPDGSYVRPKSGYELHIFGTAADIFATKTLWAAVEMLGLRTMPKGDKSFRHSWWVGFEVGISKALYKARETVVEETGGSSLVLVEKYDRARAEMRSKVRLKNQYRSANVGRADAYSAGVSSGQSFSGGHRIGGGAIGALGSGS